MSIIQLEEAKHSFGLASSNMIAYSNLGSTHTDHEQLPSVLMSQYRGGWDRFKVTEVIF